jgi:hypothetical protein
MQIYRTEDMEGSIRKMVRRNSHPIVFEKRWCRRHIPVRKDLVEDIPSMLIIPKGESCFEVVKMWGVRQCLLWYRWREWPDWRPQGEAMLFVECPLEYEFFEWICRGIRREIIVYQPPSWSMQEETIIAKNPGAGEAKTIVEIASCFRTKPNNLMEELALILSGFPRDLITIFTSREIESLTQLKFSTIRKILRKGYRANYAWYRPIRMNGCPDDPTLRGAYLKLDELPKYEGGLLMVRSGMTMLHPQVLSNLYECNAITIHNPIHIVIPGRKAIDLALMDAMANVKMGSWYKMRRIVEEAPLYEEL